MKTFKRAKKLVTSTLVVAFLTLGATASCYAGTVRGRIERRDAYGRTFAAAYVQVTLYSQQQGRSSPAYTGVDGMYYLYNVPSGSYTLEVWVSPDRPLTYGIQVYNQPYTDIPPILIP